MSIASPSSATDNRGCADRASVSARIHHSCLDDALAWMTLETTVAIGSGIAAGSLTLTALGIDSLIELRSACVLIWRLRVEPRHGQVFAESAERTGLSHRRCPVVCTCQVSCQLSCQVSCHVRCGERRMEGMDWQSAVLQHPLLLRFECTGGSGILIRQCEYSTSYWGSANT
jgi:hypothetical protein